MSLRCVNDNRLGSHVIYERVARPPLILDHPAKSTIGFKIKVPYVPQFKTEPLAWNPGTQPKQTINS